MVYVTSVFTPVNYTSSSAKQALQNKKVNSDKID